MKVKTIRFIIGNLMTKLHIEITFDEIVVIKATLKFINLCILKHLMTVNMALQPVSYMLVAC